MGGGASKYNADGDKARALPASAAGSATSALPDASSRCSRAAPRVPGGRQQAHTAAPPPEEPIRPHGKRMVIKKGCDCEWCEAVSWDIVGELRETRRSCSSRPRCARWTGALPPRALRRPPPARDG